MARPVQDGAILELNARQRYHSQRVMNVFHWRLVVSVGAVVDGDEVVSVMHDAVVGGILGLAARLKTANNVLWEWELARWQWLYPIRYTAQEDANEAGPGTVGTTALPANVSSTFTKYGEQANRHGIGSCHLSGMSVSDVTGGFLSIARRNALVGIETKMLEVVDVSAVPNALFCSPIILNKTNPAASQRWLGANVQTTSRVQRRRTVGVGE